MWVLLMSQLGVLMFMLKPCHYTQSGWLEHTRVRAPESTRQASNEGSQLVAVRKWKDGCSLYIVHCLMVRAEDNGDFIKGRRQ